MTYSIELRPQATRALRALESKEAARIRGAIVLLAENPRPPSSRKLSRHPGYRVRGGDYRILYTIEDQVLLIVVVALGHRKSIYRQG
jgi:mRNA interferase RelE/StbE